MDNTRAAQITKFLQDSGWGDAVRSPLAGDASARRYERLRRGADEAILMDAPPLDDGAVCPPDASADERRAIGYTACARLAGNNPHAFTAIATALTRRGFSAPHIFAAELDNGLILLEDLGGGRIAQNLAAVPQLEEEIYGAAIDTLAALYRSSFNPDMSARSAQWVVGDYDQLAMQTEADLFTRWYAPHFDAPISDAAQKEWEEIWADAYKCLDAHAPGLALRDFHAENIFYLPGRTGTANIGLIDFQDALFAHPSYDLVSLLEDARRDVSEPLIEPLIQQFCQQAGITDDDTFRAAYAVQAAQRNAKILGIFVRLNIRDRKPHYLDFIPRVAALFRRDLSHSALAPLKKWTQTHTPSLWAGS